MNLYLLLLSVHNERLDFLKRGLEKLNAGVTQREENSNQVGSYTYHRIIITREDRSTTGT
jgi:hypothetical protein